MVSISNLAERVYPHRHDTKTVVHTRSTTTVSTEPSRRLELGTAVRNTAIGGAVGGALGGASLLAKVSLPLLGKVTTLAGVARFAGAGAGIGLATAVLPVIAPSINRHPMLKAALTGAGIGAGAGMLLPLITPVFGAIAGAAIGTGIHLLRRHDWRDGHPTSWDRQASPCDHPFGPSYPAAGYGYRQPGLLSRLFGAGGQWTPVANVYTGVSYVGGSPYGRALPGYYGPSMMGRLGMGAGQPYVPAALQQPVAMGAPLATLAPQVAAAPPAKPRRKARRKPRKAGRAGKASRPARNLQPRPAAVVPGQHLQAGAVGAVPGYGYGAMPVAGLSAPGSYLPQQLTGVLPFAGGSPFSAGQAFSAMAPQMLAASAPQMLAPAGSIPMLTGLPAGAGMPALPQI